MCYFDGMSRRFITEGPGASLPLPRKLKITSELYLSYSGNDNMKSSSFFNTTFTKTDRNNFLLTLYP